MITSGSPPPDSGNDAFGTAMAFIKLVQDPDGHAKRLGDLAKAKADAEGATKWNDGRIKNLENMRAAWQAKKDAWDKEKAEHEAAKAGLEAGLVDRESAVAVREAALMEREETVASGEKFLLERAGKWDDDKKTWHTSLSAREDMVARREYELDAREKAAEAAKTKYETALAKLRAVTEEHTK
jgi:hypothetical protein